MFPWSAKTNAQARLAVAIAEQYFVRPETPYETVLHMSTNDTEVIENHSGLNGIFSLLTSVISSGLVNPRLKYKAKKHKKRLVIRNQHVALKAEQTVLESLRLSLKPPPKPQFRANELEQSTSWRITAPLSAIKRIFSSGKA